MDDDTAPLQQRTGLSRLVRQASRMEEMIPELLIPDEPAPAPPTLVPERSRYEYNDFQSIDWVREETIERVEAKDDELAVQAFWWAPLFRLYRNVEPWLVVLLIGVMTAFFAAYISVGVDFFSAIRVGICTRGITHLWKNHKYCCFGSESECTEWKTWPELVGLKNPTGAFLLSWIIYVMVCCTYTAFAALWVKKIQKYAAGSGIAEAKVIIGGFVMKMFVSWQTLVVKALGLILSVSSGLAIGREGPMVHVGACCAHVISQLFPRFHRNQVQYRHLLAAACGVGLSCAFGAPIAGVLFTIEEMAYYLPHSLIWRSFLSSVIGALTLQFLDPMGTGKLVIFSTSYSNTNYRFWELLPHAFLGIVGGLAGAFFIKFNMRMAALRSRTKLKNYFPQEAVVVTLITSIIFFCNDYLKIDSGEMMGELFAECSAEEGGLGPLLCERKSRNGQVLLLLCASAMRLLFMVFSFGLKVPAGLFVPSLAAGACFGRAVGIVIQLMTEALPSVFGVCTLGQPCVTPGVYALVGAATFLCGVSRFTVGLVVMMLEISGEVSYLLPLAVAVMCAKWTGDAIDPQTIYDEAIVLNDFPFLENKYPPHLEGDIRDATKTREMFLIEASPPPSLESLTDFVNSARFTGYPIVHTRNDMVLLGYILRSELRRELERAAASGLDSAALCFFQSDDRLQAGSSEMTLDLRPLMDNTPTILPPDAPLNVAYENFRRLGVRYILLQYSGRFCGLLTKKDLLSFNSAQLKKKKAARVSWWTQLVTNQSS